MYCGALLKSRLVCGQPLADGSTSWCGRHAKKMCKYYLTYKSIESQLHLDHLDVSKLNLDQLLEIHKKLLKVYHYRTTLQTEGYPEYKDEGHVKRIEFILHVISTVSSKIIEIEAKNFEDVDFIEPSVNRSAVATSRKQKKTKVRKMNKGAKVFNDNELIQRRIDIIDQMSEIALNYYVISFYAFLDLNFAKRFGKDRGHRLLSISACCATSIYLRLYDADTEHEDPILIHRKETPKEEQSFECAYHDFKTFICNNKRKSNVSKYVKYLYILNIVLHSYRIDTNNCKFNGFIDSISTDQSLRASVSNLFCAFIEKRYTEKDDIYHKHNAQLDVLIMREHIITDILPSTNNSLPQLDIGFCMRLAFSDQVTARWQFVHIGKDQYRFISPSCSSSTINLADIQTIERNYNIVDISYENMLKVWTLYGCGDFIESRTVYHSLNRLLVDNWFISFTTFFNVPFVLKDQPDPRYHFVE